MARVVWITGLPGSGKTTLAKLLRNELKNIGELCVLIDGDEIRSILGNELGYDRRTRESLANIYQNFIEFFIHQDISVIVSTASVAVAPAGNCPVRRNPTTSGISMESG